jgi:hypothetical protein
MIYIIYDTALNGLYTLMQLQQHYPVHESLFKGTRDEPLIDVAPYIFLINDNGEKISSDREISIQSILVIESNQNLEILASHFREFIYQKINGRECYFRFWDARVIKKFLPGCSQMQLSLFFRNINSITVRDEDFVHALQFRVQQSKLYSNRSLVNGFIPIPDVIPKAMFTEA